MAKYVDGQTLGGGVCKQTLQVMDGARIEVDVGPVGLWVHVEFGRYPDSARLVITKGTAHRLADLLVKALSSHGPTAVSSDGTPYDPDEECDLTPDDTADTGGEG